MTNDQILEMAKQNWFAIISQPTSPTTIERYPAPHDEQSIIAFARLIEAATRDEDAQIVLSRCIGYAVDDYDLNTLAAAIRKGEVK